MRGLRYFFPVLFLSVLFPFIAPQARAQQQVTLGNASAPLTGPWKFRTGDSPQAKGASALAWAQPGFDDSAWGTMDLTPPSGSFDPILGSSGYLPGWTARGYPGYSGYAWYRLRVNIQNNIQDVSRGSTARLAIKMPDNYDDAYQVFVNGNMIGQFGQFTAHGVTAYEALPRAFSLPADVGGGPVTIAIRMWMAPFTPLVDPDAGGLHGPPVLGEAAAVDELLKLDWDSVDRATYLTFFEVAALPLALLVAFGLFWLDRQEPAFLWLGITCAFLLLERLVPLVANYIPMNGVAVFLIQDAILRPGIIGLWVVFWAYWFRLDRMFQIHRMVWGLVVLLGLGMAMLRAPLYGSVVPVHAIVWLSPLTLGLKLLLGVLLVWVVYRGIYKEKAEGWLALPAVVLVGISIYQEELIVLHIPAQFFPFGVAVSISQVALIVSLTIISVLLVRRFLHSEREREQWRLEMEQARQVQQMLIPEALPVLPGFTLESEYRPAQQVGGDFFQIIQQEDGSILIVVGDVNGKGLKAAMLVSLIVGTIRTLAKFTRDPMEVLRGLNERLCGRMQGHFATCMVAHIAPDGSVALANAGHLPPYLNGNEVVVAGSLPLGMIEAAEFSQIDFQLCENDRLTLMTDGVLEAQNADKELFGFTRTQQISNQPAAVVVEAAQKFGQEDDITVISVVRSAANLGAPEPALSIAEGSRF